ncbi:MAG: lipase [Gammaproteobacteria bacterium HGW-Gammaproteobacteria-6]|nr:MAG: lipase [Gammaproteobacteria bacterium HGW-Gammaproteobacteria-6]
MNAYQLAVMAILSYAPFSIERKGTAPSHPPPYLEAGSIGNVLREQLACQIKPTLFEKANFHLLSEEVPYSKRFEVVPYDPERYQIQSEKLTPEDEHFLHDDETDTQAFITHNDKIILISIRGSASPHDWLRDFDARQVPIEGGTGSAHRGFHEAYKAAQLFTDRYLNRFHTNGQTVIVCGHSLGGSIALLLADWIKRLPYAPNVILYTYGAPRAGDAAFVESAKDLVHHRLVNNNDLVPSVPARWMDSEWKVVVPGLVMLLASLAPPAKATSLLLAGLVNLKGDAYQHHGEQYYFMPRRPGGGSEASVLWQPGCAALEEGDCARFSAELSIVNDEVERRNFIIQIASFSHHYKDTGYARAALTNLLRWNASLSRGGQLFTEEEVELLRPQLTKLERELANWTPGSFTEFRNRIRLYHDSRFYNKTDTELLTFYRDDINSLTDPLIVQQRKLTAAQQRLTAQASIPITAAAVFGDQANREDLQQLVSEWRQEELNLEAERVANVESASTRNGQYA